MIKGLNFFDEEASQKSKVRIAIAQLNSFYKNPNSFGGV
jgi:hypothetical protein